ncbi:MAG: hypothetical protein ABSG41_28415 [Bryobacteraceae bacterium]|jgi:hypothetical protein
MPTVYLYVVGASSDPDAIKCGVPWKIDEDEIFFGPCKKRLREKLRSLLLGPVCDRAAPAEDEDIYFAGFNALPNPHVRKLVWAGRLKEAMSFARAWLDLTDKRYSKMRQAEKTPLHVEPISGERGRPNAYHHHGLEHKENMAWIKDVATDAGSKVVRVEDSTVRLPSGTSWWDGFGRDICFLFENIFFATEGGKGGREIDNALVEILQEAQRDRQGVDQVAVFGLNAAGNPDGRVGSYLELSGLLADRFVAWLREERRGDPAASRAAPPSRSPHGC